jgi:hypothetical protein
MKTVKITIAAAFLFMAIFQVGAAFADSANISDILKYTSYFKTTYKTDVSVLNTSNKAVKQLEKLDLILEGQIRMPDKSLELLQCNQPVCGGGTSSGCDSCNLGSNVQF